ncbi:Rhodanese domain-containing protein [Fusarium keratoplasticum]|uniref:Rhodanese domain-containing protein n=1 Tax=Fusarium keratoplasticum TaxID=1328300 RepID=A0ACC0R7I3_9HYPO|nr:Rhodanese domain-containing protein [Fusarium keratoplasticum]KAI8675697.1 Rhodanese domain-containing protein [Fusarium keratoplasticum]
MAHPTNVPWYDAYPKPSTLTPPVISRAELLEWIKQGKEAGNDYLVVDLRRDDHTGGFLRGSLNLPIESLYPALPTIYNLVKAADIQTVIWYCADPASCTVTSRGRGYRAAAWFGDFLAERNELGIKSVALFEGILGWALAGDEYTQHIDEFDPTAWKKDDASKHTCQLK